MALFREEESMRDAIDAAFNQMNKLDRTFIEKDYWVTQVIRSAHVATAGGLVLKGGTSLSKGYGIIKRFSEDVDVLVVPEASLSVARRATRLTEIKDAVAVELGLEAVEKRNPGLGRQPSRGDYLMYDAVVEPEVAVDVEVDRVLLETGYSDGHEPSEMVHISTYLGQLEGVDQNAYADLKPFSVRALLPARTLVEKMCALHNAATNFNPVVHDESRLGRHYYDIYNLLLHEPTRKRLSNRNEFLRLVVDVERISEEQYGSSATRPADGFAASPAFALPNPPSEIRAWLEGRFNAARTLFPPGVPVPSFKQVLALIQQQASLL